MSGSKDGEFLDFPEMHQSLHPGCFSAALERCCLFWFYFNVPYFPVTMLDQIFKFRSILAFRQLKLHSIRKASKHVLVKARIESSKPAKNLQGLKVSSFEVTYSQMVIYGKHQLQPVLKKGM